MSQIRTDMVAGKSGCGCTGGGRKKYVYKGGKTKNKKIKVKSKKTSKKRMNKNKTKKRKMKGGNLGIHHYYKYNTEVMEPPRKAEFVGGKKLRKIKRGGGFGPILGLGGSGTGAFQNFGNTLGSYDNYKLLDATGSQDTRIYQQPAADQKYPV